MIPALIAPGYNRFDLLERMLRSIDQPIGRTLIIDNARTGYMLPVEFDLEGTILEHLGDAQVFAPPYLSLGYPGSINFGITQTPDAPWWLWASNDIEFGEGDLENITELMEGAGRGPRLVTHDFAWGALNRALVDLVGLFDDWSFWPLYFDDNDYGFRCHLAGVTPIRFRGNVRQGADGFENSLTINSDPILKSANSTSWTINEGAYVAKWGGLPGHETFRAPWDHAAMPLWATKPDLRGRVLRGWPRPTPPAE